MAASKHCKHFQQRSDRLSLILPTADQDASTVRTGGGTGTLPPPKFTEGVVEVGGSGVAKLPYRGADVCWGTEIWQ